MSVSTGASSYQVGKIRLDMQIETGIKITYVKMVMITLKAYSKSFTNKKLFSIKFKIKYIIRWIYRLGDSHEILTGMFKIID